MPGHVPPAIDEPIEIPIFRGLRDEQREELFDQCTSFRAPADQLLVLDQEESKSLMVLRSGIAKVRSFTTDGDDVTLSLLGPGDVFGEMALFFDGRRTADVVALTDCEAVRLRSEPFCRMVRTDPALAYVLARLEARRLVDFNQRFMLGSADATTRLLGSLLDLALHSDVDADPGSLIPPLPQRELASLSGLARETASRAMSKLRQKGIIVEVDGGGLRIANLEALRRRGLLAFTNRH